MQEAQTQEPMESGDRKKSFMWHSSLEVFEHWKHTHSMHSHKHTIRDTPVPPVPLNSPQSQPQ